MGKVGTDKRLNYYRQKPEEVLLELHSHNHGLTNPEAQRRLDQHGRNILVRYKSEPLFTALSPLFKNLFFVSLILSGALLWYVDSRTASLAVLLVIIAVMAIHFITRRSSGTFLSYLEKLSSNTTKVKRSGQYKSVDSSNLVIGDIVKLEPGSIVPADLRLLEVKDLITDDFDITGYEGPVTKTVAAFSKELPVSHRTNVAFMGSRVIAGEATGVVVATGMHTDLGRISGVYQHIDVTQPAWLGVAYKICNYVTMVSLALASLLLIIFALQNDSTVQVSLGAISAVILAGTSFGVILAVWLTTIISSRSDKLVFRRRFASETLGRIQLLYIDTGSDLPSTTNESLVSNQLKVVFFAEYTPAKIKTALKQLGQKDQPEPVVIDNNELAHLADSQLLALLDNPVTIFNHCSPESKLRLVEVAKQSRLVVAIASNTLSDVPAMQRADVSIAQQASQGRAWVFADLLLPDLTFESINAALAHGRKTARNVLGTVHNTLTDWAALVLLLTLSAVFVALVHIPIAITPAQLIVIVTPALLVPIIFLAYDSSKQAPASAARHRLAFGLRLEHINRYTSYGLLAATLTYANYLLFFERQGLSPKFIDPTSRLYFEATALSCLTFILCQLVSVLMSHSDNPRTLFSKNLRRNKRLLGAFGFSLFWISTILYLPWARSLAETQGLDFADWLTALLAAGMYLIIRLLLQRTRHSRHAVIQLHHEVHGPTSKVKI